MSPSKNKIALVYASLTLLLIVIIAGNPYPATAENNNEPDGKESDFNVFNRSAAESDDLHTLSMGDLLFSKLEEKYKNDAGFIALKSKFANAEFLSKQMISQLEKTSNKYISAVTDEVFGKKERNSRDCLAFMMPAKSFYETSIELFSRPINIANLADDEKTFLARYYDLKLRILTSSIAQSGRALAIAEPNFRGTYDYVLVLPLLHTPVKNPININILPRWMQEPEQLNIISDSCLLQFGLPLQAMMLAQKSAQIQNKQFSEADFYTIAAQKCGKTYPHIAADCLHNAIDCIPKENTDLILALQFRMVQLWLDSKNYALAAADARKIFEAYPNHTESGKAIWLYYYSLSKGNNLDQILVDIDMVLKDERCESHKAKLMYIEWWALRHKRDQSAKVAALEYDLLNQYGDDPLIAPVLLSRATDFLANQDYNQACELLTQLSEKFPSTKAAVQAKTILKKLDAIK